MKVSDLVTSSGQRYEATQNLLRTEETGAVNSGLVRSAERDALPAGRRAAASGMSNAALAAAAKSRSDGATDTGRGDAVRVTNASDSKLTTGTLTGAGKAAKEGAPSTVEVVSGHHRRSRRNTTFNAANGTGHGMNDATASEGAVGSHGSLRQSLKARAKAAIGTAVDDATIRKALENTELEGADDLYYKGRTAVRAARGAGNLSLRAGRGVVRSVKSARDRLFEMMKSQKASTQKEFKDICVKNNFNLHEFTEWSDFTDFLAQLPTLRSRNYDSMLTDSNVHKMEADGITYYYQITAVRNKGEVRPLEMASETIRRVLKTHRQGEAIKAHEEMITRQALKNGHARIYTKEENSSAN